ncbi:hypothetical protein BGX26_012154 [Mortierella sp. AD094]|nr:hypothetical protein BGX26_012154 [Mortierella sp. AD094]
MTLYPISEYEYFIPVTTCTKGDLERAFADNPPETDILRLDDSTINFRSIGVDVQQLMMYSKIIKPEYHHKGHFWWRSMLTYYAIRPNSRLREVLRRSWNSMAPCMSIHVRHSDKWMEALPLDLGFYMKYAEIYRNRTGVSSIYLLTDDQFVIERTKTYTDFQFYYMDVPRSNKGWWFDRDQGVSMDIQERNFLIDIYTAAQCQHSILTYSSNVGRLIAELTFALRNTEPSVVSLDELWMMDP